MNILLLALISMIAHKPSLACLIWSTCGEEKHNTLIIQIDNDIEHIDNRYRLYTSVYDEYTGAQWQGKLIRRTPGETVAWYPAAVKTITWNENQTIVNFELRENLTFHDGSPITARDVKYSFAANLAVYHGLGIIPNPTYKNISHALDQVMQEFEFTYAPDDPNGEGLKFTLGPGIGHQAWFPKPDFIFQDLGNWNRFMLIPEDSNGKYTDNQVACEDAIEKFSLKPISCGPYIFEEHFPQDHVTLTRFDNWYGWGKIFVDNFGRNITYPSVDEAFKLISIRIIPDLSTIFVELEAGGVDASTSYIESLGQIEEFKDNEYFTAFQRPSEVSWMIQLNTQGDHPDYFGGPGNYPFNQLWFRQVLAHAINRTNIVQNVKGGIGAERTSLFPDWIIDAYPNLDTSDYYTLDTDPAKAIQILEDYGYIAGLFVDDPLNRFGHGPYLNETQGQISGHVFKMVVDTSDKYNIDQSLAIVNDLEDVGIMVEPIMLNRTDYLSVVMEEFSIPSEWGYNQTTQDPLPEWDDYMNGTQDPYYQGPEWDMFVSESSYQYESPEQYVLYASFIWWYWHGGEGGIYIPDYETQLAKIEGSNGFLSFVGSSHYETDSSIYPYPIWDPDDTQFVEAAEEAGRIFTNDLLQYIPFLWDFDTYAQNKHLKNFLPDATGAWDLAYCYWETDPPNPITTDFEIIFLLLLLLLLLLVLPLLAFIIGLLYDHWKRK